MNEYFQEHKISMDYADYLKTRADLWRVGFHFIGFLKRLIIVSLIVVLRESPAILLYTYISAQIIMIVLIIVLRPFLMVLLNIAKLASEVILLIVLGLMLRCLLIFNNLRESKEEPGISEIEEYLRLGEVLNGFLITFIAIQILIFFLNIYILLRLIYRKRISDQNIQC